MCEFDKKSGNKRIDPCMRNVIRNLKTMFSDEYEVVASCCGHGRYPMTIVVKQHGFLPFTANFFELFSNKTITRKRKFYKKDGHGMFFIPEVSREKIFFKVMRGRAVRRRW